MLIGADDARIAERGHATLSTHGILNELPKAEVRAYIEQLTAQGWLARDPEHQTLAVTPPGWRILRGQVTPKLHRTDTAEPSAGSRGRRRRDGRGADAPMDGATKSLFERLRELRKQIAEARGVPAYVVFGDAALRDMARRRPQNKAEFRKVSGVGERKCEQYAPLFLPVIRQEALEDAAG